MPKDLLPRVSSCRQQSYGRVASTQHNDDDGPKNTKEEETAKQQDGEEGGGGEAVLRGEESEEGTSEEGEGDRAESGDILDALGCVISRMDTETSESSIFLRAGPGERDSLGNYQFRKIDKTNAPDCTVIGVIARNYIRFKRWRRGVTVSVVPYNKQPTKNIWPHIFNLDAAFWGLTTFLTFGLWGWQMVKWFPTKLSTWNNFVEHGLTFTLHIVFMDLVPNWLSGLLLHRVRFLTKYQHHWEHAVTKSGRLGSVFQVTTLYSWYTLVLMALWGFGVACSSPGNRGCFHWESSMWIASFSYVLVGLILRIVLWLMRHYPAMYTSFPMLLKMSRFYWAHFNFREWEGGLVFGAITPFYDVVFGTCPFDIKWSCPIPFVDFLVTDQVDFKTVRNPKRIRWTSAQWAWHLGWLAIIAILVALLAGLSYFGYFT